MRTLIRSAGIAEPVWNRNLYTFDGRFLFCPDGYWEQEAVALEVQSREFHFSDRDWQSSMQRINDMNKLGILVVQATPKRISAQPQEVLRDIEEALGAGRARGPLPIRVTKRA